MLLLVSMVDEGVPSGLALDGWVDAVVLVLVCAGVVVLRWVDLIAGV